VVKLVTNDANLGVFMALWLRIVLMGSDVVSLGNQLLTFRRHTVHSFSSVPAPRSMEMKPPCSYRTVRSNYLVMGHRHGDVPSGYILLGNFLTVRFFRTQQLFNEGVKDVSLNDNTQ